MANRSLGKLTLDFAVKTGGFVRGMIEGAFDSADNMAKTALRIGVSVEQMARLRLAFDPGGSSAEEIQTALVKLADQATKGNKAFAALN